MQYFCRFRGFRRLYLRLKFSNEQKELEKKIISGQVWEEFCDSIKAAGTSLLAPGSPMTAFDQAEGIRYLTRLLRAGLVNFMESKDVNRPKFTAVANGWTEAPVKIGSDNPDNLYQAASINSRYVYEVTATRNTVDFLGFYTQKGAYGKAGGLETVDSRESNDLEQIDGVITILVGAENVNNSKNFLKVDHSLIEGLVMVRQTFKLREKEVPAACKIVKLGEFSYDEKTNKLSDFKACQEEKEGNHDKDINIKFNENDKLSCEHVVEALETTALFVTGASLMFSNWAYGFQKHVNQLPLFDVERSNKVGGDPTIRYYHSYWQLEDDECLVIKAMPPNCFTWNFQVNNHWMESLDYRYFRIHVNMATAKYCKDGSVIVVLSLNNPELSLKSSGNDFKEYNWLSTTGHNRGTMCWRWIKPESFESLPQPQPVVCKYQNLPKYLA